MRKEGNGLGLELGLLIKNVRLVDWQNDFNGSLWIQDGKIAGFGSGFTVEEDKTIDGGGLVLMPSFIDLHAHFRDPGLTYKEDVGTGSLAAVKGGYTMVNLMANTQPVCSDMGTVRYVTQKADALGLIEVNQMVSITQDFDGKTLEHLDRLKDVRWISDDGYGVMDSATMLAALEKAKDLGIGLMCHEEDLPLAELDSELAENLMTLRDVRMALAVGARLHVCHVSTKEAMDAVVAAKSQGGRVTCEVTPHHLYLNNDTDYRVNPPLRSEAHRRYMVEAVKRGWADAIATDHAPHTAEDKKKGCNGISGIEHAFPVCYTTLVRSGELPLTALSRLMSKNPGGILGVNKGRLEVGVDADLVLVNPDAQVQIEAREMVSKGRNTPLDGHTLWGEIQMTIHKGRIVYDKRNG